MSEDWETGNFSSSQGGGKRSLTSMATSFMGFIKHNVLTGTSSSSAIRKKRHSIGGLVGGLLGGVHSLQHFLQTINYITAYNIFYKQ